MSPYKRKFLKINNETYRILSYFEEEEHLAYRHFMIGKEVGSLFIYQLGIVKEDVETNHHLDILDLKEWLFEVGLSMIKEMIEEEDFSHPSGLITSQEIGNSEFDWRSLPFINPIGQISH